MSLLTPDQVLRLTRINGIRRYLEDKENYYVEFTSERWAELNGTGSQTEGGIFGLVLGELMYNDQELAGVCYDLFKDDPIFHEYYILIAKYFIDASRVLER